LPSPERDNQRQFNRLVGGTVVAILIGVAVIAFATLRAQEHRAVSLESLPNCPTGSEPAASDGTASACVRRMAAVVRSLPTPPTDRRVPAAAVIELGPGRVVNARLRSRRSWEALRPGDQVEVALFGARIIQLRTGRLVMDTTDNPVVRGRRHLIFLGALLLAAAVVALELRRPPRPAGPVEDAA
jgi:hypothetical protein